MIERLPKYSRAFIGLGVLFERAFRRFDDRHVRTFVAARAIPSLAMRVGGHKAYADWCFQSGVYAGLLSALGRRRLSVLDVGCGAGEIVSGVLQAMAVDSTYLGVDIDLRLIRQCRRTFTDPRATFSVISGASPFYEVGDASRNPDLSEVCGDKRWDVIIAKAMFDHLSPKDVEGYLQVFSRALADGGLVIATFFLLDAEYRARAERLNARFRFREVYPGRPGFRYAAAFNPVPEAQLAIEAERLDQLLDAAGLRIQGMVAGTWRDPEGRTGLDMPDTLLLTRAK